MHTCARPHLEIDAAVSRALGSGASPFIASRRPFQSMCLGTPNATAVPLLMCVDLGWMSKASCSLEWYYKTRSVGHCQHRHTRSSLAHYDARRTDMKVERLIGKRQANERTVFLFFSCGHVLWRCTQIYFIKTSIHREVWAFIFQTLCERPIHVTLVWCFRQKLFILHHYYPKVVGIFCFIHNHWSTTEWFIVICPFKHVCLLKCI